MAQEFPKGRDGLDPVEREHRADGSKTAVGITAMVVITAAIIIIGAIIAITM
jgi:hypothetical protein